MRDKLFSKPVHVGPKKDSTRLKCLTSNRWSSQHESGYLCWSRQPFSALTTRPIDLEGLHVTEIVELSLETYAMQQAARCCDTTTGLGTVIASRLSFALYFVCDPIKSTSFVL